MKNKSVNDAAKRLPRGTRQLFLDIWKSTGCLDLYNGKLIDYLKVIKFSYQRLEKRSEEKNDKFVEIVKIIGKSSKY